MRSIILAALLALPTAAIAERLQTMQSVHVYVYVRCGVIEKYDVMHPNAYIRTIHAREVNTAERREHIAKAYEAAKAAGRAWVVILPADGKCHEI